MSEFFKKLEEYRGGILLFIVLVIMLNYYLVNIENIRNQEQNQVNIVEKR